MEQVEKPENYFENYFDILDAVRETGVINMLAAPMWLVENGFTENKREARKIVSAWMNQEKFKNP